MEIDLASDISGRLLAGDIGAAGVFPILQRRLP
jgi:hypothetical protein